MRSEKRIKKTNLIFKIIYFTLYILITGFIIYSLVDAHLKDIANNPSVKSYPVAYAIIGIIIGAISYGALLIMGLINIVVATFNKIYSEHFKHIMLSSIAILIPLISYFLIITIAKP